MWLVFQENGKLFWFEHSWGQYKGIHGPYETIHEIVKHVYQQNGSNKGYKFLELGEYKWKPNINAEQFLEEMNYDWKREGWKKINGHWKQIPESPNK